MARPDINSLRQMGDMVTNINWDLQIIKFPSGIPNVLTSQDFNIRCESTDVPRSTGQSVEVNIRGLKKKQPGLYVPQGTLSMTMIESVDNKITRFIRNWREGCFNMKTGSQLEINQVQATVRLVRLNRQNREIYEYVIYGVYLEDSDPGGQLGNASADLIRPTLTLSYDYFDERQL